MASLKEKIAALRTKRASQKPKPRHPVASIMYPPLLAKARADSLETECVLSDEDEDEHLVVLPPPPHHAVAQRHLWRMKEVKRARGKLRKSRTDFVAPFLKESKLPVEPCSADPIEEGDFGDHTTGHGEGDAALEAKHHSTDAPQREEDEEEFALALAIREDDEEDQDCDEDDDKPAFLPPSTEKEHTQQHENDVCNDSQNAIARQQGHAVTSIGVDRPSPGEKPGHDLHNSHRDELASLRDHNTATTKHLIKSLRDESCLKYSRRELLEDVSKPTDHNFGEGRSRVSAGLIEDEADHDEDDILADAEDVQIGSLAADYSNDEDACVEEDISEDCDASKIAAFHRKWIMNKESEHLDSMKAGSAARSDSEEEITPEKPKQHPGESHGDENASQADEAAEGWNEYRDARAESKEYINAMFLRDDSRSKCIVEGEEEDNEVDVDGKTAAERREKARALWKVRQKVKTNLFQEDENSLSKFDIFEVADRSRSAHYRMQLESSCRPATEEDVQNRHQKKVKQDNKSGGLKRKASWTAERLIPEWEKRKACMQQKDKRRQRSVSVGNWSFAAHGERAKIASKNTKAGFSGSASLGATFSTRKAGSRLRAPVHSGASRGVKMQASSKSKKPASFKGLLRILGEKAELDQ